MLRFQTSPVKLFTVKLLGYKIYHLLFSDDMVLRVDDMHVPMHYTIWFCFKFRILAIMRYSGQHVHEFIFSLGKTHFQNGNFDFSSGNFRICSVNTRTSIIWNGCTLKLCYVKSYYIIPTNLNAYNEKGISIPLFFTNVQIV